MAIQEITLKLRELVASPEVMKELDEAQRRAAETIKHLHEAGEVTPEMMRQVFDI